MITQVDVIAADVPDILPIAPDGSENPFANCVAISADTAADAAESFLMTQPAPAMLSAMIGIRYFMSENKHGPSARQ